MGKFQCFIALCCCILFLVEPCIAGTRFVGQISPGFEGAQMNWMENDGIFLVSNKSTFGLGFYPALEVKSYLLVIAHMGSFRAVWTANRGLLVTNSDKFVFEKNGNAYLKNGHDLVFSTNTKDKGVTAMELQENGNLVLLGNDRKIIWQSFSHPTDTVLPGQEFLAGMKLKSFPNNHNISHFLEMKSGDLMLYAGFQTPQFYWSMQNESRKTNSEVQGNVYSASLVSNSWKFYDNNRTLLWEFIFSENSEPNATWTLVLGHDGAISFYDLQKGKSAVPELIKIPQNSCSLPEPCDPYNVCSFDNRCQCPSALSTIPNCKPQSLSLCDISTSLHSLLLIGEKLSYFALDFVAPVLISDLNGCQKACFSNCSCLVLFFEDISGNCFMFDEIGSIQRSDYNSSGFSSYLKVSNSSNRGLHGDEDMRNGKHHILVIVIIAVVTTLVIFGLIYLGIWYYHKKRALLGESQEISEEDTFLDSISGMPIRFSYEELQIATNNFSVKLGQGGFGSVYKGVLPDGSCLAVKKLEGIGQGKKEFRSEVSIIGSVHHIHLVRLRGFCAEGAHRLLVYEYMEKGSLDKWIFNKGEEGHLDWETRFNIAVGVAKGLAYLHEECDLKIVHCDIKPENVLLDDNFHAKVSDFGLAKLMNREQSHVFTTLRGTRGYLAPEWITSYAISERSDVYSYGMVLLEIISGRKNFDPDKNSEIAHYPSYAFKMVEEGKSMEILDSNFEIDEDDHSVTTAIKVALWCIQDVVYLRPPMTKVVQMLEGVCEVPQPPTSFQMRSRLYSDFFKWSSEEGNLSGSLHYNSDELLSATTLSGPR